MAATMPMHHSTTETTQEQCQTAEKMPLQLL
jgi:hypothetical protein